MLSVRTTKVHTKWHQYVSKTRVCNHTDHMGALCLFIICQLQAIPETKIMLALLDRQLTSPVNKWMISKACLTMVMAFIFLPLLRPCIMRELTRRSTTGHYINTGFLLLIYASQDTLSNTFFYKVNCM